MATFGHPRSLGAGGVGEALEEDDLRSPDRKESELLHPLVLGERQKSQHRALPTLEP